MCMYALVGVACYNVVARAAPLEAAVGPVDWFVGWAVSRTGASEAFCGMDRNCIKLNQGHCSSLK